MGLQLATFGQQLLFITYNKDQMTSRKFTLHFLFNVALKYIKDVATFRFTTNPKVQNTIEWSENALVVCGLLNFFRFLNTGKRASLVDYLLGLDSISIDGNKRRDIGYSHMTRELIWGGFMVSGFGRYDTAHTIYIINCMFMKLGTTWLHVAIGKLSCSEAKT